MFKQAKMYMFMLTFTARYAENSLPLDLNPFIMSVLFSSNSF